MSYDPLNGSHQIKNIVLVSSGKGGVGKSSVAANLAACLFMIGQKVGLLDADIHGPSQQQMWNLPEMDKDAAVNNFSKKPFESHGVHVVSLASQLTSDQSVNWRGNMASVALNSLIYHTQWGELDWLVVDMPPGTGDIQINMCEKFPHSHVVIVTTPQDVAVIDTGKSIDQYRKYGLNILGIIENMSVFECAHCGKQEHLFGDHGGQLLADKYQLPLLARLPLVSLLRQQADSGKPFCLEWKTHHITQQLINVAHALVEKGVAES